MGIPAGWYQDLEDAARLRWWDGEAWTSATRGREALDGPPTGPSERLVTPVSEPPRAGDAPGDRPRPAPDSATPPDASHVTSAAAAAAAVRLAASTPAVTGSSASGSAPSEGRTTGADEAPQRAARTVRIDDRELGHLLDVVPEVPPHLLPVPAERRARARRTMRERQRGAPARPSSPREPAPSEVRGGDEAVPVPHVTLTPIVRSPRRARPSAPTKGRAARAPLGRRAALRRTFATGGAAALVVVLAVGFLLDDSPVEPPLASPDDGNAVVVDPFLDEIPAVPELGAPGADGGPDAEAEAARRVVVPLGGPCGTVEVMVDDGRDPASLRAWDAEDCDLAPVVLLPGQQRWIVVRASLNGSAATEASARASVERAGADGLLWSTYYASLNPDLWVVFDGPFSDRAEAEAAAREVGGGAYERVLSDAEGDRYCIAPGGCTGGVPRD